MLANRTNYTHAWKIKWKKKNTRHSHVSGETPIEGSLRRSPKLANFVAPVREEGSGWCKGGHSLDNTVHELKFIFSEEDAHDAWKILKRLNSETWKYSIEIRKTVLLKKYSGQKQCQLHLGQRHKSKDFPSSCRRAEKVRNGWANEKYKAWIKTEPNYSYNVLKPYCSFPQFYAPVSGCNVFCPVLAP